MSRRQQDALAALARWLPQLRLVLGMEEPVRLLGQLEQQLQARPANAPDLIDACWATVGPALEAFAREGWGWDPAFAQGEVGWRHTTVDAAWRGLREGFHLIPIIPPHGPYHKEPFVVPLFVPEQREMYPPREWNTKYLHAWRIEEDEHRRHWEEQKRKREELELSSGLTPFDAQALRAWRASRRDPYC